MNSAIGMESGGSICVSKQVGVRLEVLTYWEFRNPVRRSENHLDKFNSVCFDKIASLWCGEL